MSALAGTEQPRVHKTAATCYRVINGFSWAEIYLRQGHEPATDQRTARYWVHMSVVSDYGNFGYCWSHIGANWREFLARLDFHYAMNKFMGPHFEEPMAFDDAVKQARALIADRRKQGAMSKEDARDLYDGLRTLDPDHPREAFLQQWDQASGGAMYRHEFWDNRWKSISPQAKAFWADIWPAFIAQLDAERAEIAA